MFVVVSKTKKSMINVRLSEQHHEEFKIVCELRGLSMSSTLHQWIIKAIREEKERDPSVFARVVKESVKTQSKEEIERSLGLKQAQITHISSAEVKGKAKAEKPQKPLLATENAVNQEKKMLTGKKKADIITHTNDEISPTPGRHKIVMKQARYSARQEPDVDEEAA